ncbi:MAG: transketolase [Candidatus Berkelbacteria bacterium Licking1014_7]|uniref:Transketolase n=1 Tax=Candidatus Berkelbacteria bacterium Licking1014_7 TaxID=2017147 RepID=A0A554LIG7_9BACT|nr:MAG: transketolase [Candidatus Berkelbacteria bacterium Licking1014_7]
MPFILNPTAHLDPKILTDKLEKELQRLGFGEGLVEAAIKDKNIVGLCCDLTGSTKMDLFRDAYPDRFIEIGVAEQNMISVAAGMALEDKIPFAASYAVFNPGRSWDQIRISVCYSRANVKIVGAHAGISVGKDGATHQGLEDIASVRAIPNLSILAPADYEETKKATLAIAKFKGPVYIRFGRETVPKITTAKTPFQIGKAEVFVAGSDVSIIACGPMVFEAIKASQNLYPKIKAEVINCHTIKPLDIETIIESVKKTGAVVTAEEAQITGGLGGAIAEILAENYPCPMERIGVRDTFGESGAPDELMDKYCLRAKHIEKAVRQVLSRKRLLPE